ncbi:MAG: hypothetical protein ABSA51_13540 [Anaerolineaceae bacterium]|jgi:hypothetical protein
MSIQDMRRTILEAVARHELSLEEASVRLAELGKEPEEDAASGYNAVASVIQPKKPVSELNLPAWKEWWLIPFGIFTLLVAFSAYWMYLGYMAQGLGWGFWLSLTLFFFSLFGMVLSIRGRNARWLHVRVHQRPGEKPTVIALSFPIPIHSAAWLLRRFNWVMPMDVRDRGIDEMLEGLDGYVNKENPIHIQVDDEDGEHVEVFIG